MRDIKLKLFVLTGAFLVGLGAFLNNTPIALFGILFLWISYDEDKRGIN